MEIKLKCNIDDLIEESRLRRKAIAEELGVSTHQLKNIAKGNSWAKPPQMYMLAKLLRVKVTDLYTVIKFEDTQGK